jgi:predicted metal-dependent enzyme (double-stranded beta helix superfamily)
VVAGLASAVSDNELTLEAWEPRAFVRLLESPTYEAWLIAWAPFGALELHDHGGSAGAIHVVRGVLVETYTDRDERYPPQTRRVDTGEDVLVPASRVHEVWNDGPGEALSVQVYSPRVTSMTFFDSDPDRFLTPLRTIRTPTTAEADLER